MTLAPGRILRSALVALVLLCGACTPADPDVRIDPLADRVAALADGLGEAIGADDAEQWRSWIDPAGSAVQTGLLWDNLRQLDIEAVSFTGRHRAQGEHQAVELEFRWSIRDWAGVRQTPLWVIVTGVASDSGGPARILALADDTTTYRQPIWARQPTEVVADAHVAVLGTAPMPWLESATRLPPDSPELVIVTPRNQEIFAALTGKDSSATSLDVAASTVAAADGAMIVINPAQTASLSAVGRGMLISHEAVHVITDAADSPAPLWADEGYAEFIADGLWPEADGALTSARADALGESSGMQGLPTDEDFFGPDREAAYARAFLAWEVIGSVHATEVYRAIREGDPIAGALEPASLTPGALATSVDQLAAQLVEQ